MPDQPRRRLAPLTLDIQSKRSTRATDGPTVDAPGPAPRPATDQPRVERQHQPQPHGALPHASRAASEPRRSRTAVPLVLVLGGAGIVVTVGLFVVAIVIFLWPARAPSTESRPVKRSEPPASPGGAPAAVATSLPVWTDDLHSQVCPAPCCGGASCLVDEANTGQGGCKPGATTCTGCISGLSCVPGGCSTMIQPLDRFSLHLSAIWIKGAGDPCKQNRDLWLCLKPASQADWTCLSQLEACQHQIRSVNSVPVSGADLVRDGIDVRVQDGKDGPVLGQKQQAVHSEGMLRKGGLCNGFMLGVGDGPVNRFTFFLDQPGP